MKKSTITVIAILAILAAGVSVFAVLNGQDADGKKHLQDSAEFIIIAGEAEYTVTMAEIKALQLQEIQANYKKNLKAAETRIYTGVPFAHVLRLKGIGTQGINTAVFTAADRYASSLPIAEALDEDNCFIVITENGQPLGKREDGGTGPFRMILAKDRFSQRWCSFLTDVTLK